MAFWEHFPYTNFHNLNLDWILERVKNLSAEWVATRGEWNNTREEFEELKTYVQNYFDGLNVDEEIDNKLEEMYNNGELAALISNYGAYKTPQMFGAVGDGITDDSDAIQICFDAVMANGGGKVVFPAGRYAISKTIIIRPHTAAVKQDNIPQSIHFLKMDILNIEGVGFVELIATANMDYMVKTDDFSYPENVGSYSNFYTTINNIQLNGNGYANTGLYVYNALHSRIEGCRMYNVSRGLYIYGYGELYIANNVIKATGKCIETVSGGDSFIVKNDFYMNTNGGIAVNATAYSGSSLYMKNTMIPYNLDESTTVNTSIGFNIYNGEWSGVDALSGPYFICNNSFDDINKCVVLYSGNPDFMVSDVEIYHNKCSAGYEVTNQTLLHCTNVENIAVTDNTFGVKYGYSRPGHSLVEAVNCDNVSVKDNHVISCKYGGVIFYNCHNCDASGNTIEKYGLVDPASAAILFSGNSYNNTAKNNTVIQNVDATYYPDRTVIGIGESGTAGYNTALDNSFIGDVAVMYNAISANSTMISDEYGWEAPTTKTWTKGSKIWNKGVQVGAPLLWVCTEPGTPGNWTAFNLIVQNAE